MSCGFNNTLLVCYNNYWTDDMTRHELQCQNSAILDPWSSNCPLENNCKSSQESPENSSHLDHQRYMPAIYCFLKDSMTYVYTVAIMYVGEGNTLKLVKQHLVEFVSATAEKAYTYIRT